MKWRGARKGATFCRMGEGNASMIWLRRKHFGIAVLAWATGILGIAFAVPFGAHAQSGSATEIEFSIDCSPLGGESCIILAESGQVRDQRQLGADIDSLLGHDGTAVSVLNECTGCHVGESVLPEGHIATLGMPLAHCRTCHTPNSDRSLAGLVPLDHTHALSGFGCASCHEPAPATMREPATEVCLSCHGSLEGLATQTADVKPTNPHSSPHGAPFAECTLCHMQHEPSDNFCSTCHDFEFNLP